MKQFNGYTKIMYSGRNTENLSFVWGTKRYEKPEWYTFNQARLAGYKIKKNEQGVKLIRVVRVKDKKTRRMTDKFVFFYVFNIDQLER